MLISNLLLSISLIPAASAACSRTILRWTSDQYITTQRRGNPEEWSNIADNVTYLENTKPISFLTGFLSRPEEITHSRSIYDVSACAIWTELVITTPAHPRVIATQIWLNEDRDVTKIDSLISERGDWAFNATVYEQHTTTEDWATIPSSRRSNRTVLKAAADAYCDRFMNPNITVPFATNCTRLEGGDFLPCNERIGRHELRNRRYVIDEEVGAVDVFLGFQGLDRTRPDWDTPDSHAFRVEGGKIRYIHTVSICSTAGCGLWNATRPTDGLRRV